MPKAFKGIDDLAKAQQALLIAVDKQATSINRIENCLMAQQAQLRHKASKQTTTCMKCTYGPLLALILIALIGIIVYIIVFNEEAHRLHSDSNFLLNHLGTSY